MTGRPWTEQDDRALARLWNADVDTAQICTEIDRSISAVYQRLDKLRRNGLVGPASIRRYLPDFGNTVPCRMCGQAFQRRIVTQSMCPDCRPATYPLSDRPYRTDGLCPSCGVNPRGVTSTGRKRGYCRPCDAQRSRSYYLRLRRGPASA